MMTTTRMFGPATRSAANRAWACCPPLALLAACAGCATWTTRTLPAEPDRWNPPSSVRPELVLDGAYDDATGELIVSLAAVLPPGSPAPREERCMQAGVGGGVIAVGVSGLAAAGLGVGLLASGGGRDDGGNRFQNLPDFDAIGGGIALAAGLVAGLVAIGFGAAELDEEEPDCSIDEAAGDAPLTTSPTTFAVEQFIVRVVRPDGTYLVRSASGPGVRIPLEPAPFPCPGDCLATVARRAAAGGTPENDLRRERLTVEAIPQGGPFGTDAPPTASGAVDVTLMP